VKVLLIYTITAAAVWPSSKVKNEPSQTAEAAPASKVVQIGERDVVPITTRLRFTTMIVLPKEESILDFVCGDKEFWVVNGSQNFAFIKPARENGQTNLNLITASGNVYSFTLTEGGENAKPDLKVFIEPKGTGLLAAITGLPRFVPAQAIDDYRHQVEIAQTAAKKAKEDAAQQIATAQRQVERETARAREQFPASMQFDYRYNDQPEFKVAAIYRDDKFTYIRADPQETPALYEVKDGKPSLIQFQFSDGLYTVPKIVDRGYLAIGKKKLHFTREATR
jgi:type IV secretory pathway VirB9-like protein